MKDHLKVIELDGWPRAGKGSIAKHLATRQSFESTENGWNYRTVTKQLLLAGTITPDTTAEKVADAVADVDDETLRTYAASRKQLIAERGKDSLYTHDVAGTVHLVAALERVRTCVKGRFVDEVREAVADPEVHALVVDGRALGKVVNTVTKADLVLRMFVKCSPEEAALRELERGGITEDELEATIDVISARQQADATRELDPVIPEDTALNYWQSGTRLANSELRINVGTQAAQENNQILLDTTFFRQHFPNEPLEAMLSAADSIVDEVLVHHASPSLSPK